MDTGAMGESLLGGDPRPDAQVSEARANGATKRQGSSVSHAATRLVRRHRSSDSIEVAAYWTIRSCDQPCSPTAGLAFLLAMFWAASSRWECGPSSSASRKRRLLGTMTTS